MVYVLAQFSITDPKSYQRYTERFMRTLKPFRGSVLVADPQPKLLEGDWNHDKVVLLSFADEATSTPGITRSCIKRSRKIAGHPLQGRYCC